MLEIVCNGKVHYRRPHDHSDVIELLCQMENGKADGYNIRPVISNIVHTKQCLNCVNKSSCKLNYREYAMHDCCNFRSIKDSIVAWWNYNGFIGFTIENIEDIIGIFDLSECMYETISGMIKYHQKNTETDSDYYHDIKTFGLNSPEFIDICVFGE